MTVKKVYWICPKAIQEHYCKLNTANYLLLRKCASWGLFTTGWLSQHNHVVTCQSSYLCEFKSIRIPLLKNAAMFSPTIPSAVAIFTQFHSLKYIIIILKGDLTSMIHVWGCKLTNVSNSVPNDIHELRNDRWQTGYNDRWVIWTYSLTEGV